MRAIIALTSGGTARPLASSNGGDVDLTCAGPRGPEATDVLMNDGSGNLPSDLKYNSGTQMTNRTRVELPELKPGAQFAVDFDAVAPTKEGTYIMTFVVEGQLCFPYVAIIVEK